MIHQAITGSEQCEDDGSPYAALVSFYRAFNQRDLAQAQNNWLQQGEISMSNPLGGVKVGWPDINGVYERIFNGPARVYVEFYDYVINQTAEMFVASGREAGRLELNGTTIELDIRTSRIYRLQQNQWKQVHHHGSMDDPQLLSRYQQTLNR